MKKFIIFPLLLQYVNYNNIVKIILKKVNCLYCSPHCGGVASKEYKSPMSPRQWG